MTYQGCVLIRTTVFVAGTVSACALVLFQLSPAACGWCCCVRRTGGKPQPVEIISDPAAVEKKLKQARTCPVSTRQHGPARSWIGLVFPR